MNKKTYNRKYYLHRLIKKAGFTLKFSKTIKTIEVPVSSAGAAMENIYMLELEKTYHYGVQTYID